MAVAAGVVLLAWTAAARAEDPPPTPKVLSAISQYRESIPTSSGAAFPGHSSTQSVTPLASGAEQRLAAQGGRDTNLLRHISTGSPYGAPQQTLPRLRPRQLVSEERSAGLPRAVFSSAGLVADGRNGRVIGLVAVMGLVVLIGAAVGLRRRST